MKLFLPVFFGLLLVFGCVEVVEKPPEAPVEPPPILDQNTPIVDMNVLDENVLDVPDVNAPVEPEPEAPELSEEEKCLELETDLKIDTCLKQLAIAKKDILVCSLLKTFDVDGCRLEIANLTKERFDCLLISREDVRNGCLDSIGREVKDISFCNDIENNEEMKTNCLYKIYPLLEETHCTKILDTVKREDCLFEEAKIKSDYKVCALISGSIRLREYYRDQCLERFSDSFDDWTICNLFFVETRKQDCYYDMGIKTNNFDACRAVDDTSRENVCIQTVALATEQENCNEIPDKALRDECFEEFAKENPQVEFCEDVVDTDSQNNCYKDVAVANLDDTICDLIAEKFSDVQTSCYSEIANQTNEVKTCDKIYATKFNERDDCFNNVAQSTLNYEACEYIHFGEHYVSCFSSIALAVDDFGVCEKTQTDFFIGLGFNPKFGCYKDFAVAKGSPVLCETIAPATIRQECIDEIGS